MKTLPVNVRRWWRDLTGPKRAAAGEIVVDRFAGGGGTSSGLKKANGFDPDIAINHDEHAIAIHRANHPNSYHFLTDVREVNPRKVLPERPIGMLWLSPDCTHHCKAKGGKPVKRNRRALANVGVVWAAARFPRVIFLENVEEFEDWGPLKGDRPDKAKLGQSFKRYVAKLRRLGYKVEWRRLVAADYGAPTTRRRLFLIARRDGRPIVWPAATHAPADRCTLLGLKPWRSVAEFIDFSLPSPSIFGRKRPLVETTMGRIAHGYWKFVANGEPFIVQSNHQGPYFRGQGVFEPFKTITGSREGQTLVMPSLVGIDNKGGNGRQVWPVTEPARTITTQNRHALVQHFLVKFKKGCAATSVEEPMPTATAKQSHALAAAFIHRHNNNCVGQAINEPLGAIMGQGKHYASVTAFLMKYNKEGSGGARSLHQPASTLSTKQRLALVVVQGDHYICVDIGFRMLNAREILGAQFGDYAKDYVLLGTQEIQFKAIGNSVPPDVAHALVRANFTLDQEPLI